jgi:serine protease Do
MNNESSTPKPGRSATLMVLIGFISGLVGGSVTSQLVSSYVTPSAQNTKPVIEERAYVEESQTIEAIKKVSPSVVSIIATKDLKSYKRSPSQPFYFDPFGDFPGLQSPGRRMIEPAPKDEKEGTDYEIVQQKVSGGTGFIINPEGMVLTNRHVLAQENVDYTVIAKDGTEYEGEVVSIDPLNDLAVLQMVKKGELKKDKDQREKLKNLPIAEIGDSNSLQVGQKVLAIGYALGEYQNTVTSGIISAKSRTIEAGGGSEGQVALSGLLQTDAAINPGNSGGPLVNLTGQVVGVNVAIDLRGGGIGFAIPVDDVKPIMESIKQYGRIIRPALGVHHLILNKQTAKKLEMNIDHGALIIGDDEKGEQNAIVPGSAADKAGLKAKDVITTLNGKEINENYTLQEAIRTFKPGDQVTLKVWRDGQTRDVKIKLEEAKDRAAEVRARG